MSHPAAVAPHPARPVVKRRFPAVDALLELLAMCHHQLQRRCLEDRVVLLTLDLADSAARRYGGRGVELEDLTQVARLALVKAIRGYECGRGSGFAAYAIPTMTGEIKRYFRDHAWAVRPPRRLQEVSAHVAREEPALRQRLQRTPTEAELAAAVGVPKAVLREARSATRAFRTSSLDATPSDAGQRQLPDPHDAIEEVLLREALFSAVAGLSAAEREILRMRFVEERTQSDIGQLIGVSQMQVSRVLARVIGRLRADLVGATA